MQERLEDEILLSEETQQENSSTFIIFEVGFFISVRFMSSNRAYYFYTQDETLKPNDLVVVDTVRGLELAIVISEPKDIHDFNIDLELRPVVRKATKEDEEHYQMNLKRPRKHLRFVKNASKTLILT